MEVMPRPNLLNHKNVVVSSLEKSAETKVIDFAVHDGPFLTVVSV
jgi:hypothetical protein